jgi:Ca2+-binding EF-hand superfamily protein
VKHLDLAINGVNFLIFILKGTNMLNREEFKLALQAEGEEVPDDVLEKIFVTVSVGSDGISFEQFIDYMKKEAEDRVTLDQLQAAFQTLAVDKTFVTEEDLARVGLPVSLVNYLTKAMPANANGQGYDFNSFVENAFRKD